MRVTLRGGAATPFFVEDIIAYQSVATTDYSPIATYQASAKAQTDKQTLDKQIKNGFLVKNATDSAGYLYVITWSQFENYRRQHKGTTAASWSLSGFTPQRIDLGANEWCATPVVKVYANNTGSYTSTVTAINVGTIL